MLSWIMLRSSSEVILGRSIPGVFHRGVQQLEPAGKDNLFPFIVTFMESCERGSPESTRNCNLHLGGWVLSHGDGT